MVDIDVNSSPDFNEYDAEDYSDLTKAVMGEGIRTSALNSPLLIAILSIIVIVIIIYYLYLISKWKNLNGGD